MENILKGEKHRLVFDLGDGVQIKVNNFNWILCLPSRIVHYYSRFDQLLEDLHDYKLKIHILQQNSKTLEGLHLALEKANKDIAQIRKVLTSYKASDSSCLEVLENTQNTKHE